MHPHLRLPWLVSLAILAGCGSSSSEPRSKAAATGSAATASAVATPVTGSAATATTGPAATAGEPAPATAGPCRQACAHRASCVAGTDERTCVADCAALVAASGQTAEAFVAPYLTADCAAVGGQEATLVCAHGCLHVLGCGVAGDLPGCLRYCGDRLAQGTTLDEVKAIGAASCEQVKASVQLPPAGGGAAAGGGHTCNAAGVYTVCDGSYCRDHTADADMAATTIAGAQQEALRECGRHLTKMVLVSQAAYRASVKQTCRITACR